MSAHDIAVLLVAYRYPMLALLALVEGPLVAFSAGYIASLGYLNPVVALCILVGKDMLVDGICFATGRFGGSGAFAKRVGMRIGLTEAGWRKVAMLWRDHPWGAMFVSKLSYGLSLPFLVSAGISRVPYKLFWSYAAQIALLQYGFLFLLGYLFGNSLSFVTNAVTYLQIGVALLAIVGTVYYVSSLRLRSQFLRRNKLT